MSKWGKVKFKELQEMQTKIAQLQDMQQAFCEAAAKELAARLLRKVIQRTPVGEYDNQVNFTTADGKEVSFTTKKGMTGGTLRRGWTGGAKKSGASWANSLPIHKQGDNYVIDIINPVEYASYVEFGHRTRNHKGWVEGRFMLTKSEQELDAAVPQILEKKLAKWLAENLK